MNQTGYVKTLSQRTLSQNGQQWTATTVGSIKASFLNKSEWTLLPATHVGLEDTQFYLLKDHSVSSFSLQVSYEWMQLLIHIQPKN